MLPCIAALSCIPEPKDPELTNEMLVISYYDEGRDYSVYETFAIREDTIGLVSNRTDTKFIAGEKFAAPVVRTIANNLSARGYTRVNGDEDPDLGVYAYVLDDYNFFQQVSYPTYYPGSYYGGYGGYGSYYGYGPYVQTYTSTYQTLILQIVDFKNPTPEGAEAIWNVFIGDLIVSPDPKRKALEAIEKAFDQSTYLAHP